MDRKISLAIKRRAWKGRWEVLVEVLDVTEFWVDDDPLPLVGLVKKPLNLFLFQMFSKVLQIKTLEQPRILNNTYFKDGVELLPCYGADAILVKTPEDVKESGESEGGKVHTTTWPQQNGGSGRFKNV